MASFGSWVLCALAASQRWPVHCFAAVSASLSHTYRGSAHADNLFQDWSAPLTSVSLCMWWGQLLPVTALLTVGLFTSLHTEGIKLLMAA
jgi:hypothetical protein